MSGGARRPPGRPPGRPDAAALQALLEQAVALHRGGRLDEALALYRRLLQAAPRHPDCLHLYGLALHQGGDAQAALAPLERAAALAPGNPAFRRSLAAAQRACGRRDAALGTLRGGLAKAPGDAGLWALLGDLQAAGEDYAAAAEAYRRALEAGPETAPLLGNLGLALLRLDRAAEAVAPLRRALGRAPEALPLIKALAQALERGGEPAEALEVLRRGLELAPDDPALLGAYGHCCQLLGRFEAARDALERAVALDPRDADALVALAEGRALAPGDEPAARLRALLEDADRAEETRAAAGLALARALQRGGAHEAAFAAAEAANALARRVRPHDAAGYAAYVEALLEAFGPELFARLAGQGDPDPRPVFVVGLPRSGTSLVEQILAGHPRVHAAGELTALPALARALPQRLDDARPWPACAAALDAAALAGLAADYRAAWPAAAAGAARVVDKLPANYHYLGLVALALPGARIVACRRDPRDVALSNYFQFFGRGQTFTHDLGDLARQVAAHERLMAHWRALLPPGSLLELEQEALLADPECAARRLLEHLGLDWHAACLEVQATERAVLTASHRQVRQPLDRQAAGRWRAYRRQLAPFVAALAEAGIELGE